MVLFKKAGGSKQFSRRGIIFVCLIFTYLFSAFTFQIQDSLPVHEKIDTSLINFDSIRLETFNTDSVKKYFKATDTLISYQLNKIEEYTLALNKINSTLRRGFDTTSISNGLPETDSIISVAKINLKGFRGQTSLKILIATKNILLTLQNRLSAWQDELTIYNNNLNSIKEKLKKISRDQYLLIMPEDSILFAEYIKKLKPLGQKTNAADSLTAVQLKKLGVTQNRVSSNYIDVTDLLDDVNFHINNFSSKILDREFGYLWDSGTESDDEPGFDEVVEKSFKESKLLLRMYLTSNWLSRIIVLLIGILFYFLMRNKINLIKKESSDPEAVLAKANHIPRHLFTSTVVFSLMLIPFIYSTAPQAFTLSLWGIQIIALAFLIRDKFKFISGIQLLILLILFYLCGFSNLLIETTSMERWIQLFISTISVILGIWHLNKNNLNHFSKTVVHRPIIIIFITMNAAAILLNIFGRVTLAKILNTGASYGIIEAIILLVFVEIVIDAVYLIMESSRKSSRLTAYFEFKGLENRLRNILGILAGIVWLVLFTKNLHIYDFIFGGISEFLSAVHQIGDIKFSFGSIVIFGIVIWVSTLISQMVAFVFGGPETDSSTNDTHKLGSTVLLIRLAILALGVLLAFGASGIPLDKLAIIIGALGVGIGFGLQNIVNNLVSGIVIAFEKPVQIGDVIEVGTRIGTVKEVGIRSSTLLAFDGSEVIIPNGDIISQHLVNWTKDSKFRRIEIPVGIAYGSDINKVKETVLDVFTNKDQIIKFPVPFVRVLNFGDSSIDLKIYFWAEVHNWIDIKSDIMAEVYDRLNEAGIEIPFPQRDLHVRSVDEELMASLSKKDSDNSKAKKSEE